MTALILKNACIHTPQSELPPPAALAVEHGIIRAVGTLEEALASLQTRRKDVKIMDCQGGTLLPGLTDAHIHLERYALNLQKVDCETPTLAEALERVRVAANETNAGAWVLGHGWNHNNWAEGYGNALMLDAVCGERPAYLTAKSLHAAWANSAALALAGINASTPAPPNGTIVRDEQGYPTGILLENAMQLVEKVIPPPSVGEVINAVLQAQQMLFRMGITTVHDFDGERLFAALQQLDAEAKLKLRVVKGIPATVFDHAAAVGLRSGYGSPRVRMGALKLFADGALGPQTAAMLKPYEGSATERGMLMFSEAELVLLGQQAARAGIDVAVHAIGDRAVRTVLDAFAALRAFEVQEGLPLRRYRIEHVQVIHPQDVPRLAELGVVASMQPIHAPSDMYIADAFWGERAATAYAWNLITSSGAVLAFGSDAPVEAVNPFWGLYACLARRRVSGEPGEQGWRPEQCLSFPQALAGFTTGAAYAGRMERMTGKLAPGYQADLILLEHNPGEKPYEQLLTTQPVGTMIAGEWVWLS